MYLTIKTLNKYLVAQNDPMNNSQLLEDLENLEMILIMAVADD